MHILNAEIDWNHGWANHPQLKVIVDAQQPFPDNAPIWTQQANGLVFAKDDQSGIISFIYMGGWDDTGRLAGRGFGGHAFRRMLRGGRVIESNDCWSSRAECLDELAYDVVVNKCAGYALDARRYVMWVEMLGAYVVDGVISASPDTITKPNRESVA